MQSSSKDPAKKMNKYGCLGPEDKDNFNDTFKVVQPSTHMERTALLIRDFKQYVQRTDPREVVLEGVKAFNQVAAKVQMLTKFLLNKLPGYIDVHAPSDEPHQEN